MYNALINVFQIDKIIITLLFIVMYMLIYDTTRIV